ncbi:MAG: DoxX family protein [Patescibacteria group bacterium]|nr:DoxX family protein [Patescibacteria group bacterium]
MVLLVALRLSIGVHFFYEGVWKITNPEFSAEGFLANAKGPAAPLFYAMLPDINGRSRLKIEPTPVADALRSAWRRHRDGVEARVQSDLGKEKSEESEQKLRDFRAGSLRALWEAEDKLADFLLKSRSEMVASLGAEEVKDTEEVKDAAAAQAKLTAWVAKLGEMETQFAAELADLKTAAVVGEVPYAALVPEAEKFDSAAALGARQVVGAGNRTVLAIETRVTGARQYVDRWKKLQQAVVRKYSPSDAQKLELEQLVRRYEQSVEDYVADSQPDIAGYFDAFERWEDRKYGGNNGASHQKQRLWDEMMKLRGEVRGWLGELDGMEEGLHHAMWDVLDESQRGRGNLPVAWGITDLLNFAVTWALTGIGLCLILGLCTRLAALGGAGFLVFVLLTQPPWPTIYPPAPDVVGHALVVDKNFVEMVAMLLLASTAVGRWGGLDYFVENFVLRLYEKFAKKSEKTAKPEAAAKG